jgi:hypothetical protein
MNGLFGSKEEGAVIVAPSPAGHLEHRDRGPGYFSKEMDKKACSKGATWLGLAPVRITLPPIVRVENPESRMCPLLGEVSPTPPTEETIQVAPEFPLGELRKLAARLLAQLEVEALTRSVPRVVERVNGGEGTRLFAECSAQEAQNLGREGNLPSSCVDDRHLDLLWTSPFASVRCSGRNRMERP